MMHSNFSGSDMNEEEIKSTLFNLIKQLLQKCKFANKDELRTMMANICNNDRFEKALTKL